MAVISALMMALAVTLWPQRLRSLGWCRRTRDFWQPTSGVSARRGGNGAVLKREQAIPRGIEQVLASAIARIRAGSMVVEAFEEQTGQPFAGRTLTVARLAALLEQHRLPTERQAHAVQVAAGLACAATVSEELGCRAVPCMEAVLESYRQLRLMRDLQAQALAVPKATVGLLSALPAITVALGELMGGRPVSFLFGSSRGLVCLLLGICCYVAGLAWMRALMARQR
ncbi:type II secretion system F family protein [Bifidobacterium oedipodis]|uniref:Flp pilus assembly protein n=1 Tax=Bifidobacterium oedipodis TaxID=2675322 RepID=A0A7Y0EN47_9BIFI|nr:pilus assembly protein [Bifidobacterium sp. DSM 109957]NMM93335.1 hypothetical protein [Bifidobacterium sp. DSM 109957]